MTETASIEASSTALPLVAWSHVWSPLVSAELRRVAWEALALPIDFAGCEQQYWEAFQVGSPRPLVSLLLHTTLSQPGSGAREDWLRVMNHLELDCCCQIQFLYIMQLYLHWMIRLYIFSLGLSFRQNTV